MEKRLDNELRPLITELNTKNQYINQLKTKRKLLSATLQEWLFEQYTLLNALGEAKKLNVIFSDAGKDVPPSGAGD